MKKSKRTGNDNLKIVAHSIKRLLDLDEQERKIHKAQRREIVNIQSVMNRYCDDRGVKDRLAKNEEASKLLQQARNLIASLRVLFRQ